MKFVLCSRHKDGAIGVSMDPLADPPGDYSSLYLGRAYFTQERPVTDVTTITRNERLVTLFTIAGESTNRQFHFLGIGISRKP
jgi:hypothetical protein